MSGLTRLAFYACFVLLATAAPARSADDVPVSGPFPSMPSISRQPSDDPQQQRLMTALIQITGGGPAEEKQEGLITLRDMAKHGHASAQAWLGRLLRHGEFVPKDDAEAVKWLRKAADQLEPAALAMLGIMYSRGDGVDADPQQAARYLRLGADLGDANACAHLGLAYARGRGVQQSTYFAHYYFELAARAGQVLGQCMLGLDFAAGREVARDPVEGYAWLKLAEAGGSADAAGYLEKLAAEMTADDIARGEARFLELKAQTGVAE